MLLNSFIGHFTVTVSDINSNLFLYKIYRNSFEYSLNYRRTPKKLRERVQRSSEKLDLPHRAIKIAVQF